MKKLKKYGGFIAVMTLCSVLVSCSPNVVESSTEVEETEKRVSDIKFAEKKDVKDIGINENKSIYNQDDPSSLVYFYVTVSRGTEGTKTDHSLDDVNNAIKFSEISQERVNNGDITAEALVQIGDENGPLNTEFGYGATQSNATIGKRGSSSSNAAQKSYALKLNDGAGLWRGQSNIALNKHAFDGARIRNKLYFDLLKDIPEVPSIRTQFVKLYVKDRTAGSQEFVDYGIYTQAEVPTKKYLTNHGLDPAGYLYKAISFNFEKNDAIKNYDAVDFNLEEFEKVIAPKGREDNTRLLETIDAVNNTSYNINEVIDKYFDRDNYLNWMAYNILMGNIDTTMQNFYLYSPLNAEKWYIIPWDGDASLRQKQDVINGNEGRYGEWVRGISNYWGVILHQRFLKEDSNRQELAEKMEELREIITTEKVENNVKIYRDTVDQYVETMPDVLHLLYTPQERDIILNDLSSELDKNYNSFIASLDAVMPFYLYTPVVEGDTIGFSWGDAYDFKNQSMEYTFYISKNLDLTEPLHTIKGSSLSASIPKLKKGTYYWSVLATSTDGRKSKAFNKIKVDGVTGLGVEKLVVE